MHRLTAATFLLVILLQSSEFNFFRGTPTAANWFGIVTLLDPLAGLEVTLATGAMTTTMLIGMGILIVTALLLGRVFCGWVCPVGLILELADSLHKRVRKHLHAKRSERHLPHSCKYWVLAICLFLSWFSSVPVFTSISPINLSTLTFLRLPALVVSLLGVLIVVELFVPRVFCRSLCPLGALYAVLGKVAPFKVRVVGQERFRCKQCTSSCPMGIDVMGDYVMAGRQAVDSADCTRCGSCTDVCPGGTLQMTLRSRPSVQQASCPDLVELTLPDRHK